MFQQLVRKGHPILCCSLTVHMDSIQNIDMYREELSMACIRLGLGSLRFVSKFRCSTDVCVSLVQVQVRVFLRLHSGGHCLYVFGIIKKIKVRVISFLRKFLTGQIYFTVLFILYYFAFFSIRKEAIYGS